MNYFLFDKSQKYVNRIPEEIVLEGTYIEEINTAGQLELTLPVQYRLAENIFYICVNDPNDSTSYLMFKILKETVSDVDVSYTCIENAYDELASYTYIQDKRPTMAASQMTSLVLQGTRWSVGVCPTTDDQFCSFYYLSTLEALQKIVNLWNFEITFQVKIDGNTNEIKQRNVNLYTQQGSRTNKRFEYGSNLLSVKQVGDVTDLYTALIGRGKGEEVNNDGDNTDPDGYGRRITFADVEWSKSKGNPLDKAKGIEYLEDPQATAAYGFSDGHARMGMVIFQDCEDPNELIQLTYQKLMEVNHPQIQFSADIVDVGQLNLGDTVAIIRHDIGIEYSTRVFKVEHNLLDENKNSIELGDNISQSNSITQQISTIKGETSIVQNVIDTVVMPGANGNKLYFGTEFPKNATDGDIFYKDLGNGNTEMYIYNNGGWQLVVSTEQLDSIDKQVTEQQGQLEDAINSANSAVDKADQLISQVSGINSSLNSAIKDISNAQNDISNAQNDISNAQNDISNAQNDISNAQNDINSVRVEVQTNGSNISTLKQTTTSLQSSIANTENDVSILKQTATSLQSSIANNSNSISVLKQTATSLQASITDNSNSISTLKQTATSLQASITDNSNSISTLKQTATSLQSSITDNSNSISTLKQTASSLQSSITDNANSISTLKQTASSLQSSITDNANSISTLKQTATSLQSSIQTKADASQVTQLSNVIQSTVKTIGPVLLDGDFTDTNIAKYWEPWNTTTDMSKTWVGADGSMKITGQGNEVVKYIYKEYMPINADVDVTYKGKSKLTYSGNLVAVARFYYHFYDKNKHEISPVHGEYYKYDKQDTWQSFSNTITPPSGAEYVRIESYLNCNGSSTQVWLSVDNLEISNGADSVSSKISQLSDDINLRVQKGDLISQINIEAGQTLIQSDKLYLDASTVVFSGKAFIPSAAITDLSADKITTGTLNAANVNIINMNVKNLVGDVTSFIKSNWNTAYGSNVTIDGSGMTVKYGNWNTKFSNVGIDFVYGGEDQGGIHVNGMNGAPESYKGLSLNVGSRAEYFAIGAKDYNNDNQNPIPTKLVWMRKGINGYGYSPGWNFSDDVYMGDLNNETFTYGEYVVQWRIINGSNNYKALCLTSTGGNRSGFYWANNGEFGLVVNNTLYNFLNSQLVRTIDSGGGVSTWQTIK